MAFLKDKLPDLIFDPNYEDYIVGSGFTDNIYDQAQIKITLYLIQGTEYIFDPPKK